jgi:CHAD domain-containing protein
VHYITNHEIGVVADTNPEHLHQMRVGIRRLRTALQVFKSIITLPKAANEKVLRSVAKVLGTLRDLDVQIAELRDYRLKVTASEHLLLDKVIVKLQKRRKQALAAVRETLGQPSYLRLKQAYQDWLKAPSYTLLGQLPLQLLLPDLLSPLLSNLLLHPGWLIAANETASRSDHLLHDLRKACKQARYQAEFFLPFYNETFRQWIDDIKDIQERLGKLQDSYVLRQLLMQHLPSRAELPQLEAFVQQTEQVAMTNWDNTRMRYLDAAFRSQLHYMVLTTVQ